MKKYFTSAVCLIVALSMALSLSGCGAEIKAINLMDEIKANPSISDSDISDSGAVTVSDFTVRLLQNIQGGDDRGIIISPLSVLFALAMTANGANGDTLTQMENTLGMKLDDLNACLYAYKNSLPQGEKYKLDIANSIWFRNHEDFRVNKTFLQTNADYYGAEIYKAPFDSTTLKDINTWVKDNTDGMIKDILSDIPANAVMYLINAVAFDAEWQSIYYDHQIRDGIFTKEDGSTQEVSFMYSEEQRYLEDELASGFLKYYNGEKYAFAALLPNKGISLDDYIASLSGDMLHEMFTNSTEETYTVNTAIPKFDCEYETEMSELLSAMGMSDAFDSERADFSKLGDSYAGNLFIDHVLHKAYIEVGEKGTRAGAATTVIANDTGAAMPDESRIKNVYLDRPFIYMILDCKTMIPIFIGTAVSIDE